VPTRGVAVVLCLRFIACAGMVRVAVAVAVVCVGAVVWFVVWC